MFRAVLLTFAAALLAGCGGDDSSGSITEGTEGSTSEGSTGEGSTGSDSTSEASTSGSATGSTQATLSATAPSSDPTDPTDPETGCHNSGPEIDPGELLPGAVGEPYEVFFEVGGSQGPQDWVVEGDLPAGLVFDPEASSLTGVPEIAGESDFSLAIYYDDSEGCSNHPAYASYKLVIEP